MRIWQMLPSLSAGDGVGNEALTIDGILREAGYETGIYADYIAPNVPRGKAIRPEPYPDFSKKDILIYHLSIGSRLNLKISETKCRIIIRYHNITPAMYFAGYHPLMEKKCREGLWQICAMKNLPYRVLADSSYNREHLLKIGYKCPIDILPILISMEDYKRRPDQAFLDRYGKEEAYNILFVGRICPNKKQEDLIRAYAHYQKNVNEKARLFLAGSYAGMELYQQELREYVGLLGLNDEQVVLTGAVRFEEILACYKLADMFWCMSVHEGFCIPLVEAMLFQVPILARNAAAVADTLGRGGILMEDNDPASWAAQTEFVRQRDVSHMIWEGQERQLEKYQFDSLKNQLLQILKESN